MKSHIKSVVSLTAICAVIALLLAVTNFITAPIIEKQQNAAAFEALNEVLPGGEGFEPFDISKMEMPVSINEVYKEKGGGYVFKITTTGYGSGFVIMCGINAEGKVVGAKCIASTETLGKEKTYGTQLIDKTIETIDSVDTIAGATKTTLAYREAVKDALNGFIVIGGGKVDLRDEAQILADNLNEALPSAKGKFESVFVAEVIDSSISAIYRAENGEGYVFVLGEEFIAADKDGKAITQAPEEVITKVTDAAAKLNASTVSDIDITKFEAMPTQVTKAQKTATGNYILEVKGAGYGINGEWHTSGEYIIIKVAVTPDGKILSCLTLSQSESQGIGDACADSKFYNQFVGKTEADYSEIDGISGATITTDGYVKAIGRAYEAIKILEGGTK